MSASKFEELNAGVAVVAPERYPHADADYSLKKYEGK
jgi:hypothetical protein